MQKRRLNIYLRCVFLLVTLLLTSCGIADIEMTVYANDCYTLDMEMHVPAELFMFSDGPAELEADFDETVAEAKAKGGSAGWKRIEESAEGYTYHVWAKNVPIADDFTWRQIEYEGRKAYRFEQTYFTSMTFESFSFTLHAGKILDSNGVLDGKSTVTWNDYPGTMYAIVTPKTNGLLTSLIVIGSIVLVGVLLFFICGGLEGLQMVLSAGFSVGKWRVQSLKLGNDHKRINKQMDEVLTDLGSKTWELQLHHTAYADAYEAVQALELQQQQVQQTLDTLSATLQEQTTTLNTTREDFSTRIKAVEDQKQTASGNLKQLQNAQKDVEKDLRGVEKRHKKTAGEIRAMQRRIEQLDSSSSKEAKELGPEEIAARLETLRNGISTLQAERDAAAQQMSDLQAQITQLEQEQHPVEKEIAGYEQDIEQLEQEQKAAVDPLLENISELEKQVKEGKKQIEQLATQMPPLLTALGAQVNDVRPPASDLTTLYQQVDATDADLLDLSSQLDLVKARLASVEGGALRKFYLLIAYVVLSIAAIIVMIVLL